jgi:hypothetical protein
MNLLPSVHPEMVSFGSGQGRSALEPAGVSALRRGIQGRENTGLGRKMPFLRALSITSAKIGTDAEFIKKRNNRNHRQPLFPEKGSDWNKINIQRRIGIKAFGFNLVSGRG